MARSGGNRRVLYLRRPVGRLEESSFGVVEAAMPSPAEGEVLARTLFLSIDPCMRRQMRGVNRGASRASPSGLASPDRTACRRTRG